MLQQPLLYGETCDHTFLSSHYEWTLIMIIHSTISYHQDEIIHNQTLFSAELHTLTRNNWRFTNILTLKFILCNLVYFEHL